MAAVPSPPTPADATEPFQRRWLMIGFAFAATLINYLDRQVLPDLRNAPFAEKDLDYRHVFAAAHDAIR